MRSLILLLVCSYYVMAGDYCYVAPVEYKKEVIEVINRHVQAAPVEMKPNLAAEVFLLEYNKILETIPISSNKLPLRKFEFINNTPAYVSQQVKAVKQTNVAVTSIAYAKFSFSQKIVIDSHGKATQEVMKKLQK